MKFSSIVYPLPKDEFIDKEEKMWRISLPTSFRALLSKHNGGIPEKNEFYTGEHSYAIDRFLCVLENTKDNDYGVYDIDVTLTRIEERLTNNEDLVGVDLLPIGLLFAGDYLCLDYRGTGKSPAVCVWDHEESGELDPVTYYCTESFDKFLDMLNKNS